MHVTTAQLCNQARDTPYIATVNVFKIDIIFKIYVFEAKNLVGKFGEFMVNCQIRQCFPHHKIFLHMVTLCLTYAVSIGEKLVQVWLKLMKE